MNRYFKNTIKEKFRNIYGESPLLIFYKIIIGIIFLLILFIILITIYLKLNLYHFEDSYSSTEILLIILFGVFCILYSFLFEALIYEKVKQKLKYRNLADYIFACAQIAKRNSDNQADLLSTKPAVYNYIFIAHLIKKILKKIHLSDPKVLDWGCGYGQMIFLLEELGIDIQGIDIDLGVENPSFGYRKVMKKMPMFLNLLKKDKIKLKKI